VITALVDCVRTLRVGRVNIDKDVIVEFQAVGFLSCGSDELSQRSKLLVATRWLQVVIAQRARCGGLLDVLRAATAVRAVSIVVQ